MAPLGIAPLLDFAGLALGLLLAALLWANPRGNRAAHRWLAAYVLALALLSLGDLLEDSRWVLQWPQWAHLTDALIFTVGPLLWIYVRRLTLHATPRSWRAALHWIPAVLVFAALLPFHLQPVEAKRAVVAQELAAGDDLLSPALLAAAAQLFAYWLASLWTLRRFRRALREEFSSLERRTYGWLSVVLLVNLGMWMLWILGLGLQQSWATWLDLIAVPAGLYLLAFLGLRQPAGFFGAWRPDRDAEERTGTAEPARPAEPAQPAERAADTPAPPRYARSGLDRASVPARRQRLDTVMATDKPWLENDLTLSQLAERTGMSTHHLSQLLNEELGQTFFDFINARRVAEVQRCLADPAYAGQTILEIALASGFNSKGAFNSAFRQHAGRTPSEFRRQASRAGS